MFFSEIRIIRTQAAKSEELAKLDTVFGTRAVR